MDMEQHIMILILMSYSSLIHHLAGTKSVYVVVNMCNIFTRRMGHCSTSYKHYRYGITIQWTPERQHDVLLVIEKI